MRERLMELLNRYFDIGDSYTYNLTRVKSAFDVGTIGLDDFEEYTEDDVANLADHLIDNGVIFPSVKVGQTVHILPKHDDVVILTAVEWILQDRDKIVYSTGDYEFGNSDIGKAVFFTFAEAEAALKARENKEVQNAD